MKQDRGGSPQTQWSEAGYLPPEITSVSGRWHVWVSVCTFSQKNRRASYALAAPAVWVDLDPPEGSIESVNRWRPVALRALENVEPRPTVIVDSGRGWHGYWLLNDPVAIRMEEPGAALLRATLRSIQQQLDHVGADNVGDLSRVMRLPGTMNPKPGGLRARLLRVVDERYDLMELAVIWNANIDERRSAPSRERQVAPPEPQVAASDVTRRRRGRPALGATVHDLRGLSPDARRLVVGGAWAAGRRYVRGGKMDRSAADMAAVGAMVASGWTDEMVVAVFERHDWRIGERYQELRMRESQERATTYLLRTIATARRNSR